MAIYEFVRDSLMWMATIALLWPLNAPMMGVAIKVLFGQREIDMDDGEYWGRSILASLFVALATAATLVIDWFLAVSIELPSGLVHMVLLLAYLAASAYAIFLVFNLEDFFQALGAFLIYVFLPTTVLYIVNWMFGWWSPLLRFTGSWLAAVK